jgi:hypothetical protein
VVYRLKDMSTDVSRPGPACVCPCTHGGSLSLDALARPFRLTSKRRMRLLPPRLGPYGPPHAGAYLQMSERSGNGNLAAVVSQPSLSILTRRTHSTTDDPCQVLNITIPHTSTVLRSFRLLVGDLQASSILWIASCLSIRHECAIVSQLD